VVLSLPEAGAIPYSPTANRYSLYWVGAWQTQRRLRSTEFRVQITDLKGMR